MASRLGRGPLPTVHRITIGVALAGAVVYLVWQARQAVVSGSASAAVGAVLAAAATVLIGIYLRSILRR